MAYPSRESHRIWLVFSVCILYTLRLNVKRKVKNRESFETSVIAEQVESENNFNVET